MADVTELLSPADVAAILKVHVKTVHVWLREGRLKGTKISYRTWRISRGNLEEFLKERSIQIPPTIDSPSNTSRTKSAKVELTSQDAKGASSTPVESFPPGEMKHYLKGIMREEQPSPANK
ncbi:MAG: helix-turn-helix domain-containing protein [Methanoregulaceae archaeon]